MAANKAPQKSGPPRQIVATNRKARHNYSIIDVFEAGIVLAGTEVKSLREGKASLADAFATVDDGEVWLRNVHIPEYHHGSWTNHPPRRNRKLLLHRREIDGLIGHLWSWPTWLISFYQIPPRRARPGGRDALPQLNQRSGGHVGGRR